MAKTKFIYKGAAQVISLPGKDADGKDASVDIALWPGREVELDGSISYVKSLIARGMLVSAHALEQARQANNITATAGWQQPQPTDAPAEGEANPHRDGGRKRGGN